MRESMKIDEMCTFDLKNCLTQHCTGRFSIATNREHAEQYATSIRLPSHTHESYIIYGNNACD